MPALTASGAMLVTVRVVDPHTRRAAYGTFRVDTGDDIVLVNPAILSAIGASPIATSTVQGIDGSPVEVREYDLDLDLGQMGFLGNVRVMGLNVQQLGIDGLLGDNALDQGVLVRDGPGRTWSFSTATTGQAVTPPSLVLPITLGILGLAAIGVAWASSR